MKTLFYGRIMLLLAVLPLILGEKLCAQVTFQKEYYQPNSYDAVNQIHYYYSDQRAFAVAQDKNSPSDYYFAGYYTVSTNNKDSTIQSISGNGCIAKLNYKGDVQWAKYVGNIGGFEDIKCVYNNSDNFTGLVACGNARYASSTNYQGFRIVRTNTSGNKLYFKEYMGSLNHGDCYKIEQTTDTNGNKNGFIAVGYIEDIFDKVYLVKTDTALNVVWSQIFWTGADSRGFSVKQTADKGFILTGKSGANLLIIKTDTSGNLTGPGCWQKLYTMSSAFTGKDVIEVINSSSVSEYYVLGHSNDDMVIMHLDQSGGFLNKKLISLNGSVEEASGMVYLQSGHIVISGTTNDKPLLIKTDTALNTVMFAKKYTNSNFSSSPISTNDNGYLTSGTISPFSTPSYRYYLVKTDAGGNSDCNETPLSPGLNLVSISATPATISGVSGFAAQDASSLHDMTIYDTTHCKNLCKGITYIPTDSNLHACYGQNISLTVFCPGGTTIKWFKHPNYTTVLGTGSSFTANTTNGSVTYVARCYADECIVAEKRYVLTISSAPTAIVEPITACYGKQLLLASPCGTNQTSQWINPPGIFTSAVNVTALNNATYTVHCIDQYGCLVHAKDFQVTVTPPYGMSYPVTICEGNTLVLNNYGNGTSCTWVDKSNQQAVSGTGFVPSLGTHSYRGTCTDASGCISYVDVDADVVTWQIITMFTSAPCGKVFDFSSFNSQCNGIVSWTTKVGNNYVALPSGWKPTAPSSTVYGFGNTAAGQCCRVDLTIIGTPAIPTYHDLCFGGTLYTIPFTCEPGSTQQWTPGNTVSGAGTYEVTCTSPSGCVIRKAIFNVTAEGTCNQSMMCYQQGVGVFIICPGGTASTQCQKNGSSYPFSGTTLYPDGPGTYVVTCKDAQGNVLSKQHVYLHKCDGTADKRTSEPEPVEQAGTEIGTGATTVKLYPNPSSGIINLEVKTHEPVAYQVKVLDMVGRVIIDEQKASSEKNMKLDLSGYAKGVYNVQVTIDGVLHNKRVMLQ